MTKDGSKRTRDQNKITDECSTSCGPGQNYAVRVSLSGIFSFLGVLSLLDFFLEECVSIFKDREMLCIILDMTNR